MLTLKFCTNLEITSTVKVGKITKDVVKEIASFEKRALYPEVPRIGESVRFGTPGLDGDWYDYLVEDVTWDLIDREVLVSLQDLTIEDCDAKDWIQFSVSSGFQMVSCGPPEEDEEDLA